MARRDKGRVRLLTRHGNDFTESFPHIAKAVLSLNVRSCVIGGEAIVTDDKDPGDIRTDQGHGTRRSAELCTFDLIELDGKDFRRTPIEERKCYLASFWAGIRWVWSSMSSSRATAKSFLSTHAR
jgi:bifunctional non-homologous end joining protein LigD